MRDNAISIEAYRTVAPKGAVELLLRLAERVRGRKFLHVNSTRFGGGVAEILNRLVPIMNDLGIKADWEVLEGDAEFFATSKALHNALQGMDVVLSGAMLDHYLEVNRQWGGRTTLEGDLVLIHDPQPAPLVDSRPPTGKWVWRCHIDLSSPDRQAWRFLHRLVSRYDAAVFSLPAFAQRLTIPQFLVYPSIDPFSEKNRDLSEKEIEQALDSLAIPTDKPILLQVSRFDRFKDPLGVIKAYRLVKRYHHVRLVLAGGGAADDPEGSTVLEEVRAAAEHDEDIFILDLPPDAHRAINALQRAATVVIQKSTREGFGLTVTEAMWKGKPVIGGATGGITSQILYGVTGYTVNSVEGAAYRLGYLLSRPELIRKMGEAGREHVRRNFLITRHLRDYLSLLVHLTP
jgi:trehalose synthase